MSNPVYSKVNDNDREQYDDQNTNIMNDSLLLLNENSCRSIFRGRNSNSQNKDLVSADGVALPDHTPVPMTALQQPQNCSIGNDNSQDQQRRLAILLLFACVVLVFADQNLMSPNLSTIAAYFHFNDIERDQKLGGDIALAFFVLGAPASFVIGTLADHYNRIYLFAMTIIGGEGACFLTYFVTTYRQLYICRAITGVSMGGILPLIYSLLGDMFTAEERHAASSYVGIGMGLGISLGQGVAGFIGPVFGWRVPFLIVSIPAMICSILLLCFVNDPERGGMEAAVRDIRSQQQNQNFSCIVCSGAMDDVVYTPPPLQGRSSDESSIEMSALDYGNDNDENDFVIGQDRPQPSNDNDNIEQDATRNLPLSNWEHLLNQLKTFRSLLSTPTLLLALFQGAPGCLPWGIVNTYLNDYLSVNRNMSIQFATFVVLLFGIGNFFGMLIGGHGGGYLYRIDVRFPAILAGLSAILACVPFWILLNYVDGATNIVIIGSISISTGVLSGITGPIIKATLQNVTLPSTRGQAFALFNTFDDMGRGLGPVFVANLIVQFGSRTSAFNIGVLGWAACGIMNLFVFCTVRKDETLIQSTIARNMEQHGTTGGEDTDDR